MTVGTEVEPAASPQVGQATERMLVAKAAIDAALDEAGVIRGHDGGDGRYATLVGRERLAGVVVAALRDGRYSVDLYLIAALVALGPLAERVRAAVLRGVEGIGLASILGPVDITFLAVEEWPAP